MTAPRGCWRSAAQGGVTLAQDEASSAVFGMPQAAERLGAVTEMLPLDKLADGHPAGCAAGADMTSSRARDTVVDRVAELLHERIGLRPDPTVRGRLHRAVRDELNDGDHEPQLPRRGSPKAATPSRAC